ncbi:hypothetical protein LLG88_13460 [bacterium]|nr:hypothetical protein [bacterium]
MTKAVDNPLSPADRAALCQRLNAIADDRQQMADWQRGYLLDRERAAITEAQAADLRLAASALSAAPPGETGEIAAVVAKLQRVRQTLGLWAYAPLDPAYDNSLAKAVAAVILDCEHAASALSSLQRERDLALRGCKMTMVTTPDGECVAAPCAISGCQYREVERLEAALAAALASLQTAKDTLSVEYGEHAKTAAERDAALARAEALERQLAENAKVGSSAMKVADAGLGAVATLYAENEGLRADLARLREDLAEMDCESHELADVLRCTASGTAMITSARALVKRMEKAESERDAAREESRALREALRAIAYGGRTPDNDPVYTLQAIAKAALSPAPEGERETKPPGRTEIEFTLAEVERLHEAAKVFIDTHDMEPDDTVTVVKGGLEHHSGAGLYVFDSDYPDEGSIFLGDAALEPGGEEAK